MIVLFGLIAAIGYVLGEYYNNQIFFFAALGLSLFANVGGYWFSDKLALSMASAKLADPLHYPDLHNIVENLAITAGLPKPAVYIMHDASLNAFATGRNAEHAAVAVTTGLLEKLDRSELEGVIAHELAHIGNRDILIGTIVIVFAGLISIVSNIFIHGGFRSRDSGNKNPIMLVLGLLLIILAPIGATLIRLAISRKREYLADATGALLTRYPEGLAKALEKISGNSVPLRTASDATAHLYISNPFGSKFSKGIHGLFATHPPIEERISILRGMK